MLSATTLLRRLICLTARPALRRLRGRLAWSIAAALILFSGTGLHIPTERARLTLVVEGLRNGRGTCRFALFDGPEGYPREQEKTYDWSDQPIRNGRSEWTLSVPYGTYAVSFHHDENNNKEMEYYWYGMPEEGFGASNDASGRFSAPEWEDAKFPVRQPRVSHTMTADYR